MFLGDPPGNYDRILDFSTAVTGCLFFVPTVDFLDDPPPPPPGGSGRAQDLGDMPIGEDSISASRPADDGGGSLGVGALRGPSTEGSAARP
jgi:putative iron-dependent peroxidase